MTEIPSIIDLTTIGSSLLAEYTQVTLNDEQIREPAIRGILIVVCFVVIPVLFAWFMQKCADAYERLHPVPDGD